MAIMEAPWLITIPVYLGLGGYFGFSYDYPISGVLVGLITGWLLGPAIGLAVIYLQDDGEEK